MFICCKITVNFEHPVLYRIKYYISKSDILFLFSKSDTKISYPLNFPVMQAERSFMTYFFKKSVWIRKWNFLRYLCKQEKSFFFINRSFKWLQRDSDPQPLSARLRTKGL